MDVTFEVFMIKKLAQLKQLLRFVELNLFYLFQD